MVTDTMIEWLHKDNVAAWHMKCAFLNVKDPLEVQKVTEDYRGVSLLSTAGKGSVVIVLIGTNSSSFGQTVFLKGKWITDGYSAHHPTSHHEV